MEYKAYSILLSEKDTEIIERIKELRGMRNTSDVVRQSLREWVDRIDDPSYVKIKKEKPATQRTKYETPEDRLKAKMARAKEDSDAKVALILSQGLEICELLDGVIVEDGPDKRCRWKTYDKVGGRVLEGAREKSLDMMHPSMVDDQYKGGTKEEVQALLAKQNK